ncbi:MAG: hypothetical protein KDA59_01500 [Planctomycetales bacterium]|nr:hypothetical protein [Planctomycetales bacterium]
MERAGQRAGEEFRQTGIIKRGHRGAGDRDRFDVVMVDEPTIEPFENLPEFKNRPTLDGYAPAEVCIPGDAGSPHEPIFCKQFVILHEPIRADGIGRAVAAGVTPARVNVLRETDTFAEVAPGNLTSLRSTPFGTARILWKEGGLGVKWAVVRLGDRPRFGIFQLAGNWVPGANGTVYTEAVSSSGDPPRRCEDGEPDGWMKMDGRQPVFLFLRVVWWRSRRRILLPDC